MISIGGTNVDDLRQRIRGGHTLGHVEHRGRGRGGDSGGGFGPPGGRGANSMGMRGGGGGRPGPYDREMGGAPLGRGFAARGPGMRVPGRQMKSKLRATELNHQVSLIYISVC